MLRRLGGKAGGHAARIVRVVSAGAAAGGDTAETVGVVGTDGPAPRIGRRAGGVVLVMDLAVARLVIVILGLVVLFRAVGIGPGAVVFVLRKQKQVIGGTGDIAGGVGSASGVVAVLGHRFHNRPEIRRQGCQQGVGRWAGGAGAVAAQHGLSHVAVIPPAAVRVRRVHGKGAGGAGIVSVIAVYQAHQGAVDLADLEVNQVASFLGAVVVEPQNEHIDGQVGKSGIANLTIDHNGLHITNGPIVGTLTGATHFPDGGPIVVIEDRAHKGGGNLTRLAPGGCVVCARRDFDRHGGRSARLIYIIHRYLVSADADSNDPRIARLRGNRTIPSPGNCDLPGGVGGVQGERGRGNTQAPRRLANSPRNIFRGGGAVRPFIVRGRGKGGRICSGIGGRGRPAEVQLCRVVIVPARGKRGARIGEAPALARDGGDHSPGDGDGRRHSDGDAVLGVFHGDALIAEGGKGGGARGVPCHRRGVAVRIGGRDDHTRRRERLSVSVRGLCGRRGDGNRDEFRGHGHGLGGGDASPALCVSDRYARHAVREGAARLHGVARGGQLCPVGIRRRYNHARWVETLAREIARFCGRRGDGDTLELDPAASADHVIHISHG